MSEQLPLERCGQYRPRRGLAFEVRSVRRNSGFKPYGWEIVDYITGEPVRQSAELFRRPGDAWTAGMIAMAEKALEKPQERKRGRCPTLPKPSLISGVPS